ncbi:acetolactate synthase, large subunit, biosynthetic type [Lachnoclostridium sp. An196]|uniref:biosynthetic-type acetolactate synthase large subunit n=1 Tax=Lachnoclostridium sp. An196 TaxID=1965583 RepID=UPI000B3783DE|nr:biosynthetic-type acetolactate synthase large subunit [Lachnoclostridium sp. An196]OUP19050.1 acetolactate synthase, large subunit, biosynthetic type [Lachnoclostridium sp. An196]HIS07911.1 biosynthetic-type acetolactate synthase large subunit [Candidatus Choladocola avistercoris]
MKLTGAEIVIACLEEQGVDTVFGYPGGAILNIYDALYKHGEIRHILTSHEQGASHAADGYARATGKVGVCFATSGPGATNLVTGIATAYMDSVPIVAITCNVGNSLLGKDSFQEVDITGITMPITKYNFIVKDVNNLAGVIRRAFKIARTGRPGPVLIDITKDATSDSAEYTKMEPEEIKPDVNLITEEDLETAVKLIRESEKPMIFVGGGAILSNASEELLEFAEKVNAPVCDTLMGKGAFSGEHPLYVGMLGMHGTKYANFGVCKCDLLITVGSRFSDRVSGDTSRFAMGAKVLQIDVDPAEINKNVMTSASVIGDVKEVLKRLNPMLEQQNHSRWIEYINDLKVRFPMKYDQDRLTGPYVVEEIYRATKGDAIICTDVGQHQMWTAQYYKFSKPRTLLTSGGLGTMGYGLGAAIGAKLAKPEKTVINIAGDGCFRMNMNELATASRYNIPVIEVILNNHVLGMVRQWQTLFYDEHYSATTLNDKVDFVKVAEALGCRGIRVTSKEELAPALKEAMECGGPVVLDCQIDSDDKVFPMVPAGAPIENAFDQDDLDGKG